MISVLQPNNPIKFLAFDTNNLLLFLVRFKSSPLGIYFVVVALDFQVFLAQQSGLKNPTPKNLDEVVVVAAQNEETNKM